MVKFVLFELSAVSLRRKFNLNNILSTNFYVGLKKDGNKEEDSSNCYYPHRFFLQFSE